MPPLRYKVIPFIPTNLYFELKLNIFSQLNQFTQLIDYPNLTGCKMLMVPDPVLYQHEYVWPIFPIPSGPIFDYLRS